MISVWFCGHAVFWCFLLSWRWRRLFRLNSTHERRNRAAEHEIRRDGARHCYHQQLSEVECLKTISWYVVSSTTAMMNILPMSFKAERSNRGRPSHTTRA